jgi:hypothetical protein
MKRVSKHKCDEIIRFVDFDIDFLIEEIEKMDDNKKYLIIHKRQLFSGQQFPLSGKEWKLCIPEIKNPKIELI